MASSTHRRIVHIYIYIYQFFHLDCFSGKNIHFNSTIRQHEVGWLLALYLFLFFLQNMRFRSLQQIAWPVQNVLLIQHSPLQLEIFSNDSLYKIALSFVFNLSLLSIFWPSTESLFQILFINRSCSFSAELWRIKRILQPLLFLML